MTTGELDARRLELFEQERPRLMGISYRLLSSVTDAEDVLQEAWLRWSGVDVDALSSPQAMLTTITTRLSLDRLRRVQKRREAYPGPWLPESVVPLAPRSDSDPETAAELADSLSMALLVVLETLSPLQRAAFVLREVFEYPYPEVARVLGRGEPAVRQLVRRARAQVDEGKSRFEADRSTHAAVVERFVKACQGADFEGLLQVLAPDVVVVGDGGGVAKAPLRPVHGAQKVARLFVGISRNLPPGTEFTLEPFNGRIGIVMRVSGTAISAMAVGTAEGSVQSLKLLVNPEKLRSLQGDASVDMV